MVIRIIVTLTALMSLTVAAVNCTKKKKDGADPVTTPTPQPSKNVVTEVEYGKEVIEGDSVIFRGQDKVFYIKATPHTAKRGTDTVKFEGVCGDKNSGVLRWDFGDGSQVLQGPQVQHTYMTMPASGDRFPVKGSCAVNGQPGPVGVISVRIVAVAGETPRPGQNPVQNPGQGPVVAPKP